ncbi:MAG: 30S ribosomal protein S12 methylthiotransferase RimO [Lentisphaeria bacterium]|nr:30S ribosomal protein S12 methylthiotransferase RimO [Lentisphaeria bacterium]
MGSESKNFFIAALGCPKNIVESELISGAFLAGGDCLCADPDDADIYVINTCAFLPEARAEAAAEIAQAVEWKAAADGRMIAVAGCLMNHAQFPEFKEYFPEVDLWCHINDTANIRELLYGKAKPVTAGECTYLCNESMPRMQLTLPHVAYLKISDGCNNRCAYCAIPGLRGALRSRPLTSVLAEADMLLGNGVKELIIIAQDITAYGHDLNDGTSLASLLRALDEKNGDFVIRLLYTHPAHYTDELIEVLSSSRKVLPYLDMPLQHISERILKEMNRHIDGVSIRKLIKKLRDAIPDLTLRTTFITGLPGETEKEFAELCDFVKEFGFERMGVFSYAPEPGTPAAEMTDQIPQEIADQRAAELMDIQAGIMKRADRKRIGKKMRVLVDAVEDGIAVARGENDAPDIDNVIQFNATKRIKPGDFVEVNIIKAFRGGLWAEKARKTSK